MKDQDKVVETEEFEYRFEISKNREQAIDFRVSTYGVGKDEVARLTSYMEKIKSDIKNIITG